MTADDRDSARLEAAVHGRVQGVGFRIFVARRASALGLGGWVENERSGSVRVTAEGPRTALGALLAALREGPPGARVERVDETWSTPTGVLARFDIRTGWHRGD